MKITGIETFVVDTGFSPRRPWLFSAARTDAGLSGYGDDNGHLSTLQALNLGGSVSNVKIMELDPDPVPCRDELFTARPEIRDGHMTVPMAPGWGTDLKRRRGHTGDGLEIRFARSGVGRMLEPG
jgi:L-alanine-DL-glutamate epimerase-like enolase superfamily enzyme